MMTDPTVQEGTAAAYEENNNASIRKPDEDAAFQQ